MGKHQRQRPPWLLGLMIAVVVFVVALLAMNVLGFGDDPVIGSLGTGRG